MKYYTGIGTRNVSNDLIDFISWVGISLAKANYILRSGAADGCDKAFELGCDLQAGSKEIFIPWRKFSEDDSHISLEDLDNVEQAETIAEQFHPSWQWLKFGAKKLHTRNVYQVLGEDLQTPSKFVVCYTTDGEASGGTGQAMRIAEAYDIPIYNLYHESTRKEIEDVIKD
jgi:hypothetical protein